MRLYVVVRADLAPGLQMAQAVHAAQAFAADYPDLASAWRDGPCNVVCLGVHDRSTLARLAYERAREGAPVSVFEEPDLGGEATAFATLGERLFPTLPLALRESGQRAA